MYRNMCWKNAAVDAAFRAPGQEADHSEAWTGAALVARTGTHVLAAVVVFPSIDD